MSYGFETLCQHLENENSKENAYGAMSYPIYQTATFSHYGVGKSTGFDYSRASNPTRSHLEQTVASLEKGTDAFAYSSGMAAITALMEIFNPGDNIIIGEDLYGGSVRLFTSINAKNGLTFTTLEEGNTEIEDLITEATKAVFIETPTNPMMNVTDIRKLSEITKKHGLLLIVDNTFLSPYLQNPLELGADVVVHSGTKYLGGHNDTLAGFTVVKDASLAEKIGYITKSTGAILAPFDSFLIQRGIKTLPVRMERAQKNALEIANVLKKNRYVTKVLYPGLEEHPGHDIMLGQARGFGGMLTFEVDSEKTALRVLEKVKIISFAESLGGTETLITYPITQTHREVPKQTLDKIGLSNRVLRMSVGIESIDDLIADLEQALEE